MPTLTINAPTGAVTTINGVERNTLTAEAGASAEWSVFSQGKGTRAGEMILNRDTTLDVRFVEGNFNVNFLTNEAFDAMGLPEANGIYAVECDPVIEFFPTKEDILTGIADGSEWYRRYKSGWVEQGGISAPIPGNGTLTVTLLKPMLNNTYTIIGGAAVAGEASVATNGVSVSNLTAESFRIDFFNAGASYPVCWEVIGQGA